MRLKDKVALITGAARGIGRACAIEFAKQGADLILVDIGKDLPSVPYKLGSKSQLECTAQLCKEQSSIVQSYLANISNQHEINKTVEIALNRFGKIDILLNNAGIAAPSGKITHEISEEEWSTMIDINLSGAWRIIRAVGPSMISQRSGSIINISSTAGVVGYRNFAAYVAAKHGIIGLTKAVALDYAPLKVRVNALCPGSIRDSESFESCMLSEIARSLNVPVFEHEETFIQAQPMNTLIEAEDIAYSAVWLGSDESKNVTGSVIVVDGGFSAR